MKSSNINNKSSNVNNNKICKINLGVIQLEYILKRTSRKSIGIAIDKTGVVTVSAPNRVTEASINEILIKKSPWITDKLTKIKEQYSEIVSSRSFINGETLPYLGKLIKIEIREDKQLKKPIVRLSDDSFVVYCDGKVDAEKIKDSFKLWYLEQFQKILKERVHLYSQRLGVKPGRITIREQKTRWGSCSSKGNLNFNWRLVMASPEVLDYVVIHELCHMKHMNHSNNFWALVQNICPRYKEYRKWLKDNGIKLSID